MKRHKAYLEKAFTLIELLACQSEAHRAKRSMKFTLIELLVVITVIAILASLLLPALSRAKYKAREKLCINNMKQQGIGLMLYTSDNEEYYPMADDEPISTSGFIWNQHSNNGNATFNTAKLIRSYWGGDADDHWKRPEIEQCPIGFPLGAANNVQKHRMSYSQYWGRSEGTWPSNIMSKPMKKLDGTFKFDKRTNPGYCPPVNVLLSDVLTQWRTSKRQRFSNHHDFVSFLKQSANNNFSMSYASNSPDAIDPYFFATSSGHFGGQDGSVRKYRLPPAPRTVSGKDTGNSTYGANGFVQLGLGGGGNLATRLLVPEEFVVE